MEEEVIHHHKYHTTQITNTEDVNAIVADIGSGTSRVGYSGEELPRAVFPSVTPFTIFIP